MSSASTLTGKSSARGTKMIKLLIAFVIGVWTGILLSALLAVSKYNNNEEE